MFGESLKALRRKKGITQADLAKHLCIAKSLVSMYECNQRKPSFKILKAMANFFNVDMNTLCNSTHKECCNSYIGIKYAEHQQIPLEFESLVDVSKTLTKEELQETLSFIEFLKSKRK